MNLSMMCCRIAVIALFGWLCLLGISGCATSLERSSEDSQFKKSSLSEKEKRNEKQLKLLQEKAMDDKAVAAEVPPLLESKENKKVACSTDCPDLLDRIRAGYALPNEINERVEAQLQFYQIHPETLTRNLRRAEKYLYFVVSELEARGMPLELALLPYVESNYNPFAFSHGRAAGLWQFIPETGAYFGLRQNWWYDGRRDITASTRAALTYLEQLSRRFNGDWFLALAAYNAGQGTVSRQLAKNRANGIPEDFWNLSISAETGNYVPKLLALSRIIEDPVAYGFDLSPLANTTWFEEVDVEAQIDLSLAAKLAGLTLEEMVELNPGFNRWATDPEGPHHLLVPVDRAEPFRQSLIAYPPDARVTWVRYRIKAGDTLIRLAKRYQTTVRVLQQENGLKDHNIRIGAVLMVPVASAASQGKESLAQRAIGRSSRLPHAGKNNQQVNYIVRSGDALHTIARRFSVTVKNLIRWNGINNPKLIRPGDRLKIMVDVTELSGQR